MKKDKFVIPYNSKDEISDSELLALHKPYWELVAEIGEKPDIYYKDEPRDDIYARCFLCEYTERYGVGCSFCPAKVSWEGLECLDGLYNDWRDSRKHEEKRELALEIANLELEETINGTQKQASQQDQNDGQ